jgi:hypothetical protein
MPNFDQGMSQLLLYVAMATGAVLASMWLGIVLWTLRDVRARSRDVLAQGAAVLMVGVLNVFGLVLYLMLRPRETLSEAYERSLEEEALLQGIEEKPVCPGCGRPSNALWQVCPHCAAPQGAFADAEARPANQGRGRRSERNADNRRTQPKFEPVGESPASLEFVDNEDV